MSGVEPRSSILPLLGVGALASGVVAVITLGGVSWPAFFMALAGAMLMLALSAMYQSFRGVFGNRGSEMGLRATLPERAALLDEKNALLRAIKDVAYEHEVGKLATPDFQRLDRAYRLRAKEVLRLLDEDLAPFIARAEALVAEALAGLPEVSVPAAKVSAPAVASAPRLECPQCGTSNVADAEWCKECGARVAPAECGACGASNEPDAKFCIKCASSMKPASMADGSDEA